MRLYFRTGFLKTAGGPGSGVSRNNTDNIDFLDHSPLISIGKRKEFLDSTSPLETKDIPLPNIRFKGQHKYVPEKLMRMIMDDIRGKTDLWSKPIKVIKDSNGDYHIVDGHHRYLAAIIRGREKIKAEVYPSNSVEKTAALNMEKRYTNMRKRQGPNGALARWEMHTKALGLEPVSKVPLEEREELIPLSQGNPNEQNPSLF